MFVEKGGGHAGTVVVVVAVVAAAVVVVVDGVGVLEGFVVAAAVGVVVVVVAVSQRGELLVFLENEKEIEFCLLKAYNILKKSKGKFK